MRTFIRRMLALLGMTERGLARHTGYSPGAVRNWVQGKAATPLLVQAWLEGLAAWWKRHPPPRRSE
jgi:hypothetical protein